MRTHESVLDQPPQALLGPVRVVGGAIPREKVKTEVRVEDKMLL